MPLSAQRTLFRIDPLRDPRWSLLVDRHPRGSIFHTAAWLESLVMTYGYRPVVYTSDAPGAPLTNGIVCCQVNSWLTGHRLVSLPFSDHCEPLVSHSDELDALLSPLAREQVREGWRYIELRPRSSFKERRDAFGQGQTFCFHSLDLQPSLEDLFHNFHKNCVQRKIRRAEKEGLSYEEGRSEELLGKFYRLLIVTRRRHHLPPQPLNWFRNLIACLGDELKIRVASKDGHPVASILTLRFKDTLVYKYGCSDARFHHLGGMALLFWKAIQEAKQAGLQEFDFGRSDLHNPGLIAYKDHWGTVRSTLSYLRYPAQPQAAAGKGYRLPLASQTFAYVPDGILTMTGKLLYKHMG